MKKIRTRFIIHVLVVFIIIGFSNEAILDPVQADEYFDSYGNISWEEERARLYNFAVFLERNSEMIGYIGYYVGEKDKEKDIRRRINRAKKYLVYDLKIDKSRIIVVNAGKREGTEIILQPVTKGLPSPFSN